MTCDELSDLFELYALGVLEPEERAEIEAHLGRDCATCGGNLRRAMGFNAALLASVPETAPPRRLRRRVLSLVAADRSPWGWTVAASGLAAALLISVLWFSVRDRERANELARARDTIRRSTAELSRVQQALAFLNEPETKQVGFGKGAPRPPRGNVFVNPRGVLLIASNLPALPAGKTYEMWVIPKGGTPRPAGLFQSDTSGTAFHIQQEPLDLTTTGAVAVSVEPEAGSAQPTTTPIIVAPVAGT
jgi:anti-sigma-K factor RskA